METMEEKELLRRNVCDLIEESAIECTHSVSQNLLQVATTPKAHSCVQGVVERRFYPLHVRDFYSVINVLLLQMLLLRQRLYGDGRREDGGNNSSCSGDKAMQRKVHILEQEVKESKKRYKELFKVNQQWAKDYSELNRKLEQSMPPISPSLSSSCGHCAQYIHELDSKTSLIKDLSLNYDKLKLIQSGLETRLQDSERENDKIKDEYKALSLQVQEVGGISRVIRHKEERGELIEEIRRLREKVTILERERATLQTQFNKFRYSLRELMVESETHLTGYQRPPMQFTRPSDPPAVFSDSSAGKTGGVYVVNPKQYAPLGGTGSSSIRTLPSATSGYNHDYATPQTPPGYLSRGDMFDDDTNGETDEFCTSTIEGMGRTKRSLPNTLSLPFCHAGSNGTLLSPLSVPRPLSAPGSLLDSTQQLPHPHILHKASPDEGTLKNGFPAATYTSTHTNHYSHHASNPSIGLANGSGNTMNNTAFTKNKMQTNYFKCPHCGAKFLQSSCNYDVWFDHVAQCTS